MPYNTNQAFTRICDEVGLSSSQAIKLFTYAVINCGGIPFELKVKQSNAVTVAVMQEFVHNQGHQSVN